MIHVWGIPGHTYEGGFSITAADVTIQRWEGSPVQPVLTSPVNTTPAITITGDNATLSRLNISGTSVTEGNGAGVSAMGTNETPLERLTIDGCTFSGNTVGDNYQIPGYGGGLFAAYVSDIRITGCAFSDNYAGASGGGAYIQESGVEMQDCTFSENSADLHGGGAYFDATDSVITNTLFTENSIMYGDGGGVTFCNGDTNLTNTTISENIGGSFGGGACFQSVDAEITDSGIWSNRMSGIDNSNEGAGAYFFGCRVSITDTMISGNDILPGFCGGAAFYGSDVALVNTSIEGNGAGYGSGGAAFGFSTVRTINTAILGNVVDFYGAGLLAWDSDITMMDTVVEKNTGTYGGGAYISGSNISISDSSLSGNRAFDWGGGAFIGGSNLTMTNTTVSDNDWAIEGGGLYCIGSETTFRDTIFSSNNALSRGGAVYCQNTDASYTNATFLQNSGKKCGSAILAMASSGVNITDSRIAGSGGDTLFAETTLHVENVTFDALDGNTTAISCTGWNLGLATAPVPSPGPEGNQTIHHALSVTGVNMTISGVPSFYNSSCDLKMEYDDADLGSVNESLLMLFFTNGTYWDIIPNTTVDTAEKEISVILTEADLPESIIGLSDSRIYNQNWTSLVPAGPPSAEETLSLGLVPGWNMISSPFETITAITVPDAVLGMYGYDTKNGTYVRTDPASPCTCKGYWIAANKPCTMNMTGIPLTCYQQNLSAGWNMIGCRCHPVPIANISTTPETPVSFYSYNPATGQYEVIVLTEILLPGEGYWAGVEYCCLLQEN
jgi:predicted outer membrane repeat protein